MVGGNHPRHHRILIAAAQKVFIPFASARRPGILRLRSGCRVGGGASGCLDAGHRPPPRPACGFPARGFHQDAGFRDAKEGIDPTRLTSPCPPESTQSKGGTYRQFSVCAVRRFCYLPYFQALPIRTEITRGIPPPVHSISERIPSAGKTLQGSYLQSPALSLAKGPTSSSALLTQSTAGHGNRRKDSSGDCELRTDN